MVLKKGTYVDRDVQSLLRKNRTDFRRVLNLPKALQNEVEPCIVQVEEIKVIDKALGIENITNAKVRLLCSLRLENESASLADLADLMSERLGKDITKSNINHLFRTIHEMYLRYSNGR